MRIFEPVKHAEDAWSSSTGESAAIYIFQGMACTISNVFSMWRLKDVSQAYWLTWTLVQYDGRYVLGAPSRKQLLGNLKSVGGYQRIGKPNVLREGTLIWRTAVSPEDLEYLDAVIAIGNL